MPDSRRFLALAEGRFGPMSSKTANACIRYIPETVVAVIDSTKAGQTAQEVLGFGGDIPVVASLEEGLRHAPNALLVGVAPQGGRLPDAWHALVAAAIEAGLDVWSGLHHFLGDDPELSAQAAARGVTLHDFRRAPGDLPIAAGRTRALDATIVLTVGSDCNIGKMTTQLQLRDSLVARGRGAAFAATGQTGILIEGRGIAVDAVVADFIAGAAERLTIEAAEGAEIVLVEGQGSIVHPGYSGVTYGLIHGSVPHAFVLCTQPSRRTILNNDWVTIPSLTELIRLHEAVAAPLRPARVIGIALNTHDLSDAEARAAIDAAQRETGLPVTDAVRYDPSPLTDAIIAFHEGRRNAPGDAARVDDPGRPVTGWVANLRQSAQSGTRRAFVPPPPDDRPPTGTLADSLPHPRPASPEAVAEGCLCEIQILRGSPFEPDTRDRPVLRLERNCPLHGAQRPRGFTGLPPADP